MSMQTLGVIVVRTAESLSRRASLVALTGGALAAAVARPLLVSAGKAGKNAKKTCKRQIGQCQSSVASFCAGQPLEGCEEALAQCCGSFKGCKAGTVYECIFDALLALDPDEPS